MKVTEKKLEDGLILLDAVVSTAEVSHALTMAQYGFAQQMGIQPQPGKPVAQAVEEQMGIKDLDAIVQQQAIEYLVPFAIDKRNIMPAYPPQPKAKEPLKRGQTFSFELRVAPKPEYELTSYDQVTITVPSLEVPESEVDAQIAQMAESYAEFVADEPHPVGAGDSMMLALEAFQGGKRIDNLSTDGRTYLMGMGLMPEAFESNLMGMEVGETKSFSFELPTGAGEQVETMDCTVTIKEIQKKIVPEIDDAWVEKNMPMYRNAAALRGGIADRIHAVQDADGRSRAGQALPGPHRRRSVRVHALHAHVEPARSASAAGRSVRAIRGKPGRRAAVRYDDHDADARNACAGLRS